MKNISNNINNDVKEENIIEFEKSAINKIFTCLAVIVILVLASMASSYSSNSSRSKNYKFSSFLNLTRSRNSQNIIQVKEKLKQLKSRSGNTRMSKKHFPKKLKWYDIIVKNSENKNTTANKPRSSIPIECRCETPPISCCIRITNLTRNVTIVYLRKIFSGFGTIKKIDLHFNRYDKISKGFSYIMFSTSEEAENAVENMNRSRIYGHKIICEIWWLPYKEFCVSSILHNAGGAVGYQRNSSRSTSPMLTIQHLSQPDRLRSHSRSSRRYKLKSRTSSLMYYHHLPTSKSRSRSPRQSRFRSRSRSPRQSRLRSRSRSPRQSRLRSRSNSLTIHHSKSPRRSSNRSTRRYRSRSNFQTRLGSKCSNSSRLRSSKISRSRYSRKSYY